VVWGEEEESCLCVCMCMCMCVERVWVCGYVGKIVGRNSGHVERGGSSEREFLRENVQGLKRSFTREIRGDQRERERERGLTKKNTQVSLTRRLSVSIYCSESKFGT
jgi:hypothetical protein